ncbi:unnamed protein product, partial [Prorocentrum cordatum]
WKTVVALDEGRHEAAVREGQGRDEGGGGGRGGRRRAARPVRGDATAAGPVRNDEEDDDDDNEGQPQCWLLWLLWLLRKCSLPRPRPAALAVAMLEMAGPAQVGPPARQQESWLCCRRCWSW